MTDLLEREAATAYNERSLKTLVRSITLSQGQFSLILVRCNYEHLRQQMVQQLCKLASVPLQEIVLSASVKTLYTTLLVKTRSFTAQRGTPVSALMVFGLESVTAIDDLLNSTNQVRDEFRKNFSCPLILWVTDDITTKMIRLAPDFKSWAAATIKFEMAASELVEFLRQQADTIFQIGTSEGEPRPSPKKVEFTQAATLLNATNLCDLAFGTRRRRELEFALQDLRNRGQQLEPSLEASLQFVIGRDYYVSDQTETALLHYQKSLAYWQQQTDRATRPCQNNRDNSVLGPHPLKEGLELERSLSGATNRHPLSLSYWLSVAEMPRNRSLVTPSELWPVFGNLDTVQPLADWIVQGTTELRLAMALATQNLIETPSLPHLQLLERQGIVLFHMALCHRLQAARNPVDNRQHWQETRDCLEQSRDAFDRAGRPDLGAGVATYLGEVLQRLEAWEELQILAESSLQLHFTYGTPAQLAQDYGFLALVALQQSRWHQAQQLAHLALAILDQASNCEKRADSKGKELERLGSAFASEPVSLEKPGDEKSSQRPTAIPLDKDRSFYLLLLAQSLRQLGRWQEAVRCLERATTETDPKYDPRLYIDILTELRSLYFEQGEYFNAFRTQKTQRSLEYQYGFRAFIGAGQLQPQRQVINPDSTPNTADHTIQAEMSASCRQQDIHRLLERIGRDDHKLTIIHGPSGVGKSSLVNAGLVPALKSVTTGGRDALPIVVQVYTDWVAELERGLTKTLQDIRGEEPRHYRTKHQQELHERKHPSIGFSARTQTSFILHSSFILEQLRHNADNNLLTVLIFDQFEEFFFVSQSLAQRQLFYEFLRACLNLPFVKVILSLREDYLHYLLECDRVPNLDAINNNILDKQIRYNLRNFSLRDARAVIRCLTERAQFYLEPALIDALVEDLADELQEVRPIELQVVGAELQDEGIVTLQQYQRLGPKPKEALVKRWLDQVILDCGPENEDAAWKILFSLTDEKGTRPIKTKHELALVHATTLSTVHDRQFLTTPGRSRTKERVSRQGGTSKNSLDLILEILVSHGLLCQRREVPEDRYQLVHDYLVRSIRQRFGLEARLHQAEVDKKMSQAQLTRANRTLKQLLSVAIIGVMLLASSTVAAVNFWRRAVVQKQLAVAQTQRADINTLTAASEALFLSNSKFDALMESLRAGKQWRQIEQSQTTPDLKDTEIIIAAALQQAVYGVKERNRLEGHADVVWGSAFSPDGSTIASASVDKTVKLWRPDGSLIATLQGHQQSVAAVAFSPDSQRVASGSFDQTIKLWRTDGTLLKTFRGHKGNIASLSFSPNGKLLASASGDKTVKLWQLNGTLVRTLVHRERINWVQFSPDGRFLATATDEGMVQLWRLDGRLVAKWQHAESSLVSKVYSLSFSPDGQVLASAGEDKTVKLWDLGVFVKPRRRGTTEVETRPILLRTLREHTHWVFNLSFSPNGKLLASASADGTIKVWSFSELPFPKNQKGELRDEVNNLRLLKTLAGHGDRVTQVSFSPDSRVLASSSYDKTVRLWGLDDAPLKILAGHKDRVQSVAFSHNGQLLASASVDKTIKIWNRAGTLQETLTGHTDRVASVSFSPDGQLLASGSYDRTVKLWRLRHPLPGNRLRSDKIWLGNLGGELADSFEHPAGFPWESFVLEQTLQGHSDSVTSVSFSPDGQLIASASKDGTVKLWQRSGKLIATLRGHHAWVTGVSFSPDSQRLVTASDDGTVKLWSREGQFLRTIGVHKNFVLGVSFSPDGQLIASAGYDNLVKLWTLEGKLVATLLKGSSDSVASVSFSPDGLLVASGSYDSKVKLWSRNGTLLKTLAGHQESVMSVSFSPDGKMLASASRDKTVILWNLDLDDLMLRGCDWVKDYLKTNPNVSERDRHLCE